MQNEYKTPEKPKAPKKKAGKPKTDSKVAHAIRSLLDGTILTRDNAKRLVPFVLFLTGICILYIANAYYAEKTLRHSNITRKEIKELENEYLSTKSELMMCSKQSEVAVMLDTTGVVESVVPPKKIFVKDK